jgi:uncharacterized membrane protein
MLWLALAYPLLAHLAVWLREPRLQWLSLTVLVAMALFDGLKQRRLVAWCGFALAAAALYALTTLGAGMYALYLAPILLPAALCAVFARSLRSDATPLITRFAAAVRESMPDELVKYTGRLTVVWTVVLAAMTLSALFAALFASAWWWSLLTNFIHYGILGALFLGEYLLRRYKFPHLEHPGFFAYVRLLLSTRLRSV